jgi:hypothetical protein
MLSVSVMLMFLWYGFLAIGTYLLIMFFCTVGFHRHVNETINKSKYQDMWLLQHFGEEGRARFLAHDKMIGLWFTYVTACEASKTRNLGMIERRRLKKLEQQVAEYQRQYGERCFDTIHRTPDGRSNGLVHPFCFTTDHYGYGEPIDGQPFRPYPSQHHDNPSIHNAFSSEGYHGEPYGFHWLMAGFWDPVRRADDGELVDPMAIVEDDFVNDGLNRASYYVVAMTFDDENVGQALEDRVNQRIRDYEKQMGIIRRIFV